MKWLRTLFPRRPLDHEISLIAEQTLDEIGVFCHLDTRVVGSGTDIAVFMYVHGDTITARELELVRRWITERVNDRLGTRLRLDHVFMQSSFGDSSVRP
jgi:hypothetical protein